MHHNLTRSAEEDVALEELQPSLQGVFMSLVRTKSSGAIVGGSV